MPVTSMTVAQYNQLPAKLRRTNGDARLVFINGEWRRVVFLKK